MTEKIPVVSIEMNEIENIVIHRKLGITKIKMSIDSGRAKIMIIRHKRKMWTKRNQVDIQVKRSNVVLLTETVIAHGMDQVKHHQGARYVEPELFF